MVVLLVQQGLLPFEGAMAMVLGANVGTTSTALLASLQLSVNARRAAVANFFIHLSGSLLALPFLYPFTGWLLTNYTEPAMAVAMGHLLLNVGKAVCFLPFTGLITKQLEKLWAVPEGA